MESESEQEKRETLADIVAEIRTRSREVKEAFGGRPDGVENMLDIWADRIEAAWKREKFEIESSALSVGGVVEASHRSIKIPVKIVPTCSVVLAQRRLELLSDIERDLRARADCAERHGDRETHNDGVATLLRSIADRIEAIDSADAWRSLYTPGNAAAMREALLRCDAIAQLPEVRNEQSIKDMRNIVKHALSAPARNCDRFTDADEAVGAYRQGHKNMVVNVFLDWLFASAAEREGEGDGR